MFAIQDELLGEEEDVVAYSVFDQVGNEMNPDQPPCDLNIFPRTSLAGITRGVPDCHIPEEHMAKAKAIIDELPRHGDQMEPAEGDVTQPSEYPGYWADRVTLPSLDGKPLTQDELREMVERAHRLYRDVPPVRLEPNLPPGTLWGSTTDGPKFEVFVGWTDILAPFAGERLPPDDDIADEPHIVTG